MSKRPARDEQSKHTQTYSKCFVIPSKYLFVFLVDFCLRVRPLSEFLVVSLAGLTWIEEGVLEFELYENHNFGSIGLILQPKVHIVDLELTF